MCKGLDEKLFEEGMLAFADLVIYREEIPRCAGHSESAEDGLNGLSRYHGRDIARRLSSPTRLLELVCCICRNGN